MKLHRVHDIKHLRCRQATSETKNFPQNAKRNNQIQRILEKLYAAENYQFVHNPRDRTLSNEL